MMLMRKWERRHSLRLSFPLSSTSAKLRRIKNAEKNKSWIELNKKSPEQIDDGVSLGVVHLPSSLPNPLHEHLGKVKVRVKVKMA